MGLGDRVEAWARRFGVPPPADVRPDEDEKPAGADEASARADADESSPGGSSERFTHPRRERR